MRISKKDIHLAFARLCVALGKKTGWEEGQWRLDYSPQYGGWTICEVYGNSGINHPFGGMMNVDRMKTGTFYEALHFAIKVAEMVRGEFESVDDRETAAVLAGLRRTQTLLAYSIIDSAEDSIATDDGRLEPLTEQEIHNLCERISLGGLSVRSTD